MTTAIPDTAPDTKDTKDTKPDAAGAKLLLPGADKPVDAYVHMSVFDEGSEDGEDKDGDKDGDKDASEGPKPRRFPSAAVADEWKSSTPTVRERAMMRALDLLTDKPGWEDKVFDEAIAAKWKAEALATPLKQGFSGPMFDYVLAEMRDKARLFKTNGGITSVYDAAAAVFKTDAALSPELVARLQAEVGKLEDVDEDEKDWHPGSDEKVLDLVHPSLFPLVYGKTRAVRGREIPLRGPGGALESWGSGDVLPLTERTGEPPRWGLDTERLFSRKFQWLPADVAVDADGKAAFTSYINNLHPEEHAALYGVLEELVEKAIPVLFAAYSRAMWWVETEGPLWGEEGDRCETPENKVSRIWCMDSSRKCTTPEVCKGYCHASNNPANPDNQEQGSGDDHDHGGDEGESEDGEGTAASGASGDEGEGSVSADADAAGVEGSGDVVQAPVDAEDDDAADGSEDDDEDGDEDGNEGEDEDDSEDDEDDEDDEDELDFGAGGDDNPAAEDDNNSWREAKVRAPPSDGDVGDFEPDYYDSEDEADHQWFEATHKLVQPEPEPYKFLGYDYAATPWRNTKLQVIVKLANIHLTPDKPEYAGGSWHIEGQLNERIVATALYYYDNENITDSHLAFRTACDAEGLCMNFQYEQSDHWPYAQIYGAEPGIGGHSTVLHMGQVLTREGRLLAFPNVMQHRVGAFRLADATKPGHRKIVALFLVDPQTPVISTAHVPPQQMYWGTGEPNVVESKLPIEVAEMVYKHVGCPFKLDEAKRLREELMHERRAIDKESNQAINSAEFSFCEH